MQWSMHARLSSSLASRHGRYVGRTKFLKKPAYSQHFTLQPTLTIFRFKVVIDTDTRRNPELQI